MEEKEVKEIQVAKKTSMQLDQSGIVAPSNIEEAHRYAAYVVKSDLAPKHFDSAEKVMIAMQTARELGLPALTSLRQMYLVNGSVSLFGDLPLALVRKSGHLEYIKEMHLDSNNMEITPFNSNLDAECETAVCILKRKGEPEISRSFTWKEAVSAGLTRTKYGEKETYKNYRKRMLQMRARTWALKDLFSDVLMGIGVEEYDSTERDVTERPVVNKASQLQNLLDEAGEIQVARGMRETEDI